MMWLICNIFLLKMNSYFVLYIYSLFMMYINACNGGNVCVRAFVRACVRVCMCVCVRE